jgi:translation initiation factor 3 subunit C
MSKFFSKGGSSDSESEEEETSSEEESSEDEKPIKKSGPARTEEVVRKGPRKVVSQKDKRFDEMRQTVKQLKNAIKINDWNAISNGERAAFWF